MEVPQALTLGLALGGIGYGVASVLFFMSAYLLIRTTKLGTSPKIQSRVLLAYTIVLFICSTFGFISTVYTSWNFWVVVDPNWEFDKRTDCAKVGVAFGFLANWMADGLMVWRCIVLYRDSERKSRIITGVLISILVSSICLGASQVTVDSLNTTIAMTYFILSISLNALAMTAIIARLASQRQRIVAVLGEEYTSNYTGIIAMLIESAMLLLVFDISFVIAYARKAPIVTTITQFIGHIQVIAPLLIVLRVAQGRAWSNTTILNGSTQSA